MRRTSPDSRSSASRKGKSLSSSWMSSTPRPMRRLIEYAARSGVSMRYFRAQLPTMIWSWSSKATTDGTRLRPSSPGITTGVSPCMNATRELVVPRSIPTMRSFDILSSRCRCRWRERVALGGPHFAHDRYSHLNRRRDWPSADCSRLALQHFIHIPYQIPYVGAPVQQIHHPVANLEPVVFPAAVDRPVPIAPVASEFLQKRLVLFFQLELLAADFFDQRRIVFAQLFMHAKLFELQVEFEDFLQKVGRDHLFFHCSGRARPLGR